MKFSVCIPNYNYARYLGRTIRSVLEQTHSDFEIVVSDNASTDESIAVVESFRDDRIRWSRNRCNVGFAGNLDRAVRPAVGDYLMLLSSDDLMRPDALATYAALLGALPPDRRETVVCASFDQIDADDRVTMTHLRPRHDVWRDSDRRADLENSVGAPVLSVAAGELLHRALPKMQNPLFFVSTAYARRYYEAIEGYGAGRTIGPDKWFHWRLLGAAQEAYLIEKPLFCYRWHSANQAAQEAESSALKYLVDEYAATFEIDSHLLGRAGLTRDAVVRAFIEYDIVRHGFSLVARGLRTRARRTIRFGAAAYPTQLRNNPRAWLLRALLATGPLGSAVARQLRARYGER
jgi:hypothetical protein